MTSTADRAKNRLHHIADSANGKEVYADLMQMPLAATIGRNPHLLNLVEEALSSVKLTATTTVLQLDMGRTVGYGEVVLTTDTDAVFYARQSKTSGFTRFVKNRRVDSTQFLTISLACDEDGEYEVKNIWIGEAFPPAPGEIDETKDSKSFWENHAVVYNGQSIISNTLTKDCPY